MASKRSPERAPRPHRRAGGPGTARDDPLALYGARRDPWRTREPFGPVREEGSGRFVVHKHAARRLHYDLRLEHGGVLKSWAVPKGPSFDPGQRRLAVQVEDHPVEYAGFEGVIPAGEYGAGPSIVWDMGSWRSEGDAGAGLERGKLDIELSGYKLKGRWALVRSRDDPRSWFLIKKQDAFAAHDGGQAVSEASILSGLTTEELRAGASSAELEAAAEQGGARRRAVRAAGVSLMLARTGDKPFTRAGWLFELKYDGFRMLAERHGDETLLRFRGGEDVTARFPEIALALGHLPAAHVVLDGELAVVDEAGHPVFQRLQQRALLTHRLDVERAAVQTPATLFIFDLLGLGELDLRPMPLVMRKQLLSRLLPPAGPLAYVDHVEEQGEAFFEAVRRVGLEGIMAKEASSPYRAGRSGAWLKLRGDSTEELVVVGFTRGKGARASLGALHVAAREGDRLEYAGKVGSGLPMQGLAELTERLERLRRDDPAAAGAEKAGRGAVWVEPRLVAEVRFRERTGDGLLRQPVLLRLGPDTSPRDEQASPTGGSAPVSARAPVGREIRLTNLDKTFWPEQGYTKGDLVRYYESVAQWIIPYLAQRPVVLTRYPDGISGKSFFQKNASMLAAEWMRTVRLYSGHAQREIEYFVCDDIETLRWLANLAAIPLHVWASRLDTIDRPDWCILDLDPGQAPFADVVQVARVIEALCRDLELPCFVKTSGGSGLHVLLPLGRQIDYAQCRLLGELVARVVEADLPQKATTERALLARRGRVYIDYLQNGRGKLIAAPLCVRPLTGAPVSTPLAWSEVGPRLDPTRFDIRTVPRRMRRLGQDPLAPVLELRPDLVRALQALERRLGR